jgi:membrane protein required for colicin V production
VPATVKVRLYSAPGARLPESNIGVPGGTWLVGRLVNSTGLSGTDRLLGLVFGLLRGGVVACLLVLLLGFTPMPQDDWWRESRLMPGFERGALYLRGLLPESVAQHVQFDAAPVVLPFTDSLVPPQAPPGD